MCFMIPGCKPGTSPKTMEWMQHAQSHTNFLPRIGVIHIMLVGFGKIKDGCSGCSGWFLFSWHTHSWRMMRPTSTTRMRE